MPSTPPSPAREVAAMLPSGRHVFAITRPDGSTAFEVQPPRDNYWRTFCTLEEAVLYGNTGLDCAETGEAIAHSTMGEDHNPVAPETRPGLALYSTNGLPCLIQTNAKGEVEAVLWIDNADEEARILEAMAAGGDEIDMDAHRLEEPCTLEAVGMHGGRLVASC